MNKKELKIAKKELENRIRTIEEEKLKEEKRKKAKELEEAKSQAIQKARTEEEEFASLKAASISLATLAKDNESEKLRILKRILLDDKTLDGPRRVSFRLTENTEWLTPGFVTDLYEEKDNLIKYDLKFIYNFGIEFLKLFDLEDNYDILYDDALMLESIPHISSKNKTILLYNKLETINNVAKEYPVIEFAIIFKEKKKKSFFQRLFKRKE